MSRKPGFMDPNPQKSSSPDSRPPPRAPRWVKAFGGIRRRVVVLVVFLLLTGSDHGPGRHLDGGEGRPSGIEHTVPHP